MGIMEKDFEELATRPLAAILEGEPIAPSEIPVQRTPEQAQEYLYRTSAEGRMAGGFMPHRHTVVICGRPVQVISEPILVVEITLVYPIKTIE